MDGHYASVVIGSLVLNLANLSARRNPLPSTTPSARPAFDRSAAHSFFSPSSIVRGHGTVYPVVRKLSVPDLSLLRRMVIDG
jgi:hypothetical protein